MGLVQRQKQNPTLDRGVQYNKMIITLVHVSAYRGGEFKRVRSDRVMATALQPRGSGHTAAPAPAAATMI